jgi:hypothetical protein
MLHSQFANMAATQPPGPMAKAIAFRASPELEHAGYRLFLARRFCRSLPDRYANPGSDCRDLRAAARNVQSRFGCVEPADGLEHDRHNYNCQDKWEDCHHGLPPDARCPGLYWGSEREVCDRRHTFVE